MPTLTRDRFLLTIVVPAHNEEGNLDNLLSEIADVVPKIQGQVEVALVSDHSSDHTLSKAWQLDRVYPFLRVMDNDGEKGMGNALKKGIRNARGDYVVFVMGDATCPLDPLPQMLDKIQKENLDMVIFSRYMRQQDTQNLPMRYRISSRLFRLSARTLIGMKLNDPTDAYRVVKRDLFDRLQIERGDFSFSAEISVKAWNAGSRIGEYPGKQRLRNVGRSSFVFRRMALPYVSVIMEGVSDRLKLRLTGLLGSLRGDEKAAKQHNASLPQ